MRENTDWTLDDDDRFAFHVYNHARGSIPRDNDTLAEKAFLNSFQRRRWAERMMADVRSIREKMDLPNPGNRVRDELKRLEDGLSALLERKPRFDFGR